MTEALEGQFHVGVLDVFIGDRRRTDLGDIADLAKDLVENGQLQPILIRPRTDEEEQFIEEPWILVAGGRRMAAAMSLGWMEIAAFVRHDAIDEIKHRIMELHENIKRQEMTWQEQADAKREILELRKIQDPNITAKEVAAEIGDNSASFSRDVQASKAMEEMPTLRNASSRKAALRTKDVSDQMAARKLRDAENVTALEEVESRVVTADAVSFLGNYEDYFDLIVSDPPYGIDFWSQGQKDKKGDDALSGYDDSAKTTEQLYRNMFPAMARAMRDTGWVALFGSAESYQLMASMWRRICKVHSGYMEEGAKYCDCAADDVPIISCDFYSPEIIPWIWYRPNSRNNPRFPERNAKNMYEYILVVNMGKALLVKPTENVFVFEAEYGETRFHANQKPFELLVSIVEHLGYPGDRFCDPCAGSGTHLAAAASLSLQVFGCDSNPSLLQPMHGLIAKHFKPALPSMRDLAEVRLGRRLGELTLGAKAPLGEKP